MARLVCLCMYCYVWIHISNEKKNKELTWTENTYTFLLAIGLISSMVTFEFVQLPNKLKREFVHINVCKVTCIFFYHHLS